MTTRRITRRQALAASAASLGYLYTAPAWAQPAGANGRLKVAGIGVGGKGSSDIDQAGEVMEVVALCDVDAEYLGAKAKKWPKAKTYSDYRKLFDDAETLKNLDAVVVSTPDHNHALASLLAIRNKKHVYCQKPLTHDVYEAHLLRTEAKKHGVCTQMGNQGTAEHGLRRAVELVRGGELGDVAEVHVWTNRPIWPQAPMVTAKPSPAPVPEGLDWEAFIGPAPFRPYAKYDPSVPNRYGNRLGAYHDFHWRGWWDFGTGAIGDMACHTANMAFMGLNLGHPDKMSAEATGVNPETCPESAHVTMRFPARGGMKPVTLHWYEGKKDGKKLTPPDGLVQKAIALTPPRKNKDGKELPPALVNSGSILVGSKGIAYSPDDYGAEVYFSTGARANRSTKPEKLAANGGGDGGQKREWAEAIKAGKPAMALSNFDYAGLLTAAFLLGNVAIRTGKPFTWDGEKCQATDLPEAAKLIRREYRKGWDLIGYNG
ncbi:MAG: Gfo/Idh/MocA family oxidoreductase [Gemmataceae bacterium]|nr:Gfo/Idh/MocA family oxidoreductase [Gemmataceae bacterium]